MLQETCESVAHLSNVSVQVLEYPKVPAISEAKIQANRACQGEREPAIRSEPVQVFYARDV